MVGLLQIIIWIGCVMLILSGLLVLQIGLLSKNESRGQMVRIGAIALILATGTAIIAAWMAREQVSMLADIGNQLF